MKWISSRDAFARVLEHELVPKFAKRKLIEKLWNGAVPCMAATLIMDEETETDALVDDELWHFFIHNCDGKSRPWSDHGSVDFEKGTMSIEIKKHGQLSRITSASGLQLSKRHLLMHWPSLDDGARAAANHRPRGTSYEAADDKIVRDMRRLIDTGCNSPTAAAFQIIGRDGNGAAGKGTPENKVKRLVRRYKAFNLKGE